jgi:hypothetical protein
MDNVAWRCPVCGYEAKTTEEMDAHVEQTGHMIHEGDMPSGNIGNPGKED